MRAFLSLLVSFCPILLFGVDLSLESPAKEITAGEQFEAVISVKIPDGSYVYYKDSGDTGLPTKFDWTLPQGFKLLGEEWPQYERTEEDGLKAFVYKKDFGVRAKISAPPNLDDGKAEIKVKAEWLKCTKSQCEPGESEIQIEIATVKSASGSTQASGMPFLLLGAFLGGMILNLMPCVFPVIGLKILSFAHDASNSRRGALINAGMYSLGIVISFLLLAGLLVWLKSLGNELGWGFQLQNPVFVVVLLFLFFGMGLSFAGLVEIGGGLAGLGASLRNKKSAAFLSGVLAVLVPSPCTAPFMGASLGAALASDTSAPTIFSVFTFLGIGMAFPYVLLSAVPQLSRIMPKPGAWMETFKQFLAFPLFATAIWLFWVFLQQAGTDSSITMLFAILAFAFSLWILGKFALPSKSRRTRIFARIIFLLVAAASLLWAVSGANVKSTEDHAEAWSDGKVENLRKEGKLVYVDFTAGWCITCIANKKAVLETDAAKKLFEENNVVLLRADWTNRNPEITRKLAEFGRSSVPLNVIYPSDILKDPIILPEILTQNALIDAIDKARH